MPKTLLIALIALLLLSACVPAAAPTAPAAPQPTIAPADTVAPTDLPTATPEPTATIAPTDTPVPTPTPAPLAVALDPALPDDLRAAFAAAIGAASGDPALTVAAEGVSGDAALSLMIESDDGVTLAERFYAAVVPFDTVQDDVTFEELKARWAGGGGGPLYVTADSAMLNAIFGDGSGMEVAAEDLPATLRDDRTADRFDPVRNARSAATKYWRWTAQTFWQTRSTRRPTRCGSASRSQARRRKPSPRRWRR